MKLALKGKAVREAKQAGKLAMPKQGTFALFNRPPD
jgi:hypothetical protein